MKFRIQFGLALTLGCLVILIEGAVLVALGNFYFSRFSAEVNRRMTELLEKPGAMLSQGALSMDAFGQRDTLKSVVGSDLDDAMVVSADGVILVALESGRVGRRWVDFPELKSAWLRRAAVGGFNESLLIGSNSFLIRMAPVAAAEGEAPVLFHYVRLRTTENQRELDTLRLRLIGGLAAAMVATTVALLLGVHFLVTRRLRRIATAVERVTEGNYAINLGPAGLPDEIGFLTNGFDTMTKHLLDAFDGLRAAVRELEAAEQKYRVLVENAGESIFVVQDEKFAFANTSSHRLLESDPGALVSRELADFIHPDERAEVLERHFQRMQGEEAPSRYELRMITASGKKTIFVELNVVVIEWKGRPAALGFINDVTSRKLAATEREKLQEQLIQAQKMESIGRLAGGVAHDFNNMLQVILGNSALALSDTPPGSALSENLTEIEKSARRSADLTRQLLTFARKQAIAPQVLDLNEAISGMHKLLLRLIGENISLVWLPGHNLWPIRIDPSQVDQIMVNLCINARDVIHDSGRISIETLNLTLDDTYAGMHPDCVPGDYVLLSVSDSGHGMDAETLSHVFEPFFTTKEVGRGTGLGLATVFGIVKQNRGLINVYSEPNRGSTFKIYFPRGEGVPTAESVPVRPVEAGTETILLVEDEDMILKLGQRILAQQGYKVLCAATPEEAIRLSASYEGPIHLLITDVVMPGMNGKELREKLRTTRRVMKCLFMSGYTADIIAHHGVLDGDVEFIQKPFTIQSLSEKVRMVLR